VIWTDPALALPWPVAPEAAVLSDKDRVLPGWDAAADWFVA
jgi:dTDP-4-dehydrorhamnose 3,5-epimerase